MNRIRLILLSIGLAAIAACTDLPTARTAQAPTPAADEFAGIVARLAPVVQNTCTATGIARNCKIRLYVAQTADRDANAFQSVDGFGRPFVIVTPQLIEEAQSPDEIALVLAHEAAHHILGHLSRQQQDALFGATLLGTAAEADGANRQEIREARKIGAFVGARTFSQEYELEADALGALIARDAGYDALKGAEFFFRIPDPGKDALNTHPSNAERRAVVLQALKSGQRPAI